MNAFGITKNRFQQKVIDKRQQSVEKNNIIDKEILFQQGDEQIKQGSFTEITPITPSSNLNVPVLKPAKLINDILNKPQ